MVVVGLTLMDPVNPTVPIPLSIVTPVAFVAVHVRVTFVPAVTDEGCAEKAMVGAAVEGSLEVEELPLDGTPPHPVSAIRTVSRTRIDDLQNTRGSTTCNSAMLALEPAILDRVARQIWRTHVSHFVTSPPEIGLEEKLKTSLQRRFGHDVAQPRRTSLRKQCLSVIRAWPCGT